MTPKAAEELLQVVMHDDFVDRRKALDRWTKRWVATLEVKYELSWKESVTLPKELLVAVNSAAAARLAHGLMSEEVCAVERASQPTSIGHIRIDSVTLVLQKPRDLNDPWA